MFPTQVGVILLAPRMVPDEEGVPHTGGGDPSFTVEIC